LPDAYLVQTEILRGPSNPTGDSKSAAVRSGFLAAQAIFDPGGRRSVFIETRGTGNAGMFTLGGRAGAHPTRAGHDHIGDALAADLMGLIQSWKA
jgi:hypothetical protein